MKPMTTSELGIFIAENRTRFLPGEKLTVTALWALPEKPESVEVRLFWYTQGKGTQDVGVVGSAFDVFNLTSAPAIPSGVNLLIGVVDRWVTSGVSGSTFPAAIDQTAPNNVRSWVASYTADPPNPPTLPSTGLFGTIDSFGLPGDWLVRATGTVVPVELMGVTIE